MDAVRIAWIQGFGSESWRSGYLWLGWAVIGGLLPLWGTAFLFLLFGKNIALYEFLRNGEFVLYAASFIGGSMYAIRRDIFPSRNSLNILFVGLLGISTLIFAAITVTRWAQDVNQPIEWLRISQSALTWMSVIAFVVTTFVCLIVTVVDRSGAWMDIPAELKKEPRRLEQEFDRLQKQQSTDAKSDDPANGDHQ